MSFFYSAFIVALGFCLAVALYNAWISLNMKRRLAQVPRDPATGIIRGAEPVFLEGKNGIACLLIHGFIGSPTDFGRLPKLLNEAGFTVSVPLLPGHGTDPRDFAKVKAKDLMRAVTTAYRDLRAKHEKVILVGLSMGAALSMMTAGITEVDALVLLAPYLRVKHFWYYGLPVEWSHRICAPFIPYVYRVSNFKQVFKRDCISQIIDYSHVSSQGASAALAIGHRAQKAAPGIRCPTLILHSKKDRATDYQASLGWVKHASEGNIRLVTLEKSNHLLLWDYEAEKVEQEILAFCASVFPPRS